MKRNILLGFLVNIHFTIFSQFTNIGLDIFLGNGYRNLLFDENDENIKNQALNRKEEKATFISSFAITTEINLEENLKIKTGLGLANLGYVKQHLKGIRWPSEITPNGYKFDPSLPHEIKSKQFLQYLELPFLLQINSTGNRIQLYSSAGFVSQYMIRVKAISETDLGTKSQSGKPNGMNNFNVMYDFELGSQLKLNEKISFKIGFNYGSQLLAIDDKSLSEKLYRYGIKTSVKYVF